LKLALEALKECRDRFFPLDQHETARDLLWVPVHSAVTRCEAALAQPTQDPDAMTIAYQSGYYDGKQAARARCIELVLAGSSMPMQTKTMEALQRDRKRIAKLIAEDGNP